MYTRNRNPRSIWAARAEDIGTGSCRSIGCFQIAVPRCFACILVTVWNIEMRVGFLETRMFVLLNHVVSFQKYLIPLIFTGVEPNSCFICNFFTIKWGLFIVYDSVPMLAPKK